MDADGRFGYAVYRRSDFNPDERVTCMCEDTVIGQGSYGMVYRLKHDALGTVAVKTLLDCSGVLIDGDDEDVWKEVEALSRFRHPNAITIYGLIMERNNCSLVLEYAIFGDMYSYRKNHGQIPWSRLLSFTRDILNGLSFLHVTALDKRPITHGNINPSNILISAGEIAKVSSYGLGVVNEITRQEVTPVTDQPNRFRTSLCYMAPEIYVNSHLEIGEKTDVYSFGVTLYEMMTGCSCHDDAFANQIILCKENGKQLRVESIPADCPEILKTTFEQSTRKCPEDRPQFSDLLSELDFSVPPRSYTAWDVTLHNYTANHKKKWIVCQKQVYLASLYNQKCVYCSSEDNDSNVDSSNDSHYSNESFDESTDEYIDSEPKKDECDTNTDLLGPLSLGTFSDPSPEEYWKDCGEDIVRLIWDIDESELVNPLPVHLDHYRLTLKRRLEKIDSQVYEDTDKAKCTATHFNNRAFPLPKDVWSDPLCLRPWVADWEPFDTSVPEDGWVWQPVKLLEEETRVEEKCPWYGDWQVFDTSIDGEVAWDVLPTDMIKTDQPTIGQLDLIASRQIRRGLWDEKRMDRRRQRLAEYFRNKYSFKPEIINSYLGFVSRLKENGEKLKCLAESSYSFVIG